MSGPARRGTLGSLAAPYWRLWSSHGVVKRAGRAPGGLRWRNAAPVTPLRAHHDAEDGTSLMGSSHANATSCRQVFWQVPNARAKWHMLIGGAVPDGGPAP